MSEDAEVSLKAFIGSVWFKGISRMAVILLLPAVGWIMNGERVQNKRLDEAEKAIIIIQSHNEQVEKQLTKMTAAQEAQGVSVAAIRQDIAGIKGQLGVILRQRDASGLDLPDTIYRGILPVSTE